MQVHTSDVADEIRACTYLPHHSACLEDERRKLQGKVVDVRGSKHQPTTMHTHTHLPCGSAQLEGERGKLLGQVVNVRGVEHESATMYVYGSDAAHETCTCTHLPCSSAGFEDEHGNGAGEMHAHTHLSHGLSDHRSLQRKGVDVRGTRHESMLTTYTDGYNTPGGVHVRTHLPCGLSEYGSLQRKGSDVRGTGDQSMMTTHVHGYNAACEMGVPTCLCRSLAWFEGECRSLLRKEVDIRVHSTRSLIGQKVLEMVLNRQAMPDPTDGTSAITTRMPMQRQDSSVLHSVGVHKSVSYPILQIHT